MDDHGWWRGAVIYQIYLPSFLDANGDGLGDLPGVHDRLSYIADMGVDAIWISPFFRSPMQDSGYDVADYRAIDPVFGTDRDFDRIIATAHRLGLRVLIDQVWSHSSVDHAWFQASRQDRYNAKSDWYIWADPREDGTPPNNWLAVFGGSAWQWCAVRRQYYLHHFLVSQPKLNLRNESVLAEHFATAEFWLSRGVDGFRLDAVDFMLHDENLRDNPQRPILPGPPPWNPFRMQEHCYDMSHPDAVGLISRIRRFMDRFPGKTTLGEVSSEPGALDRVAALTTGGIGLHMAYTLGVMKTAFTASAFRQALLDGDRLNRDGWLCWAFSNHDVDRVVSRWNPGNIEPAALARLQAALLLTLPGSACLFQGEELGLPNASVPIAAMHDPYGKAFYPAFGGRDGARTPMPWRSNVANSGFSEAAELWLPLAAEHDALAVDRQLSDRHSILSTYRRLLAWRKQHPVLWNGDLTLFDCHDAALHDVVLAFERRSDPDAVIAIFNLSAEPVTLPSASFPDYEIFEDLDIAVAPENGQLRLPPYGISLGVPRP